MELWFMCLLIGAFLFLLYLGFIMYNNYKKNEQLYINIRKNPTRNGSKYIPKKIFQLIGDKNNIHPKFIKNIEYIKKLNKGWTYTLLDDKDIINYLSKNYPRYILNAYLKINPDYGAAKADFFRYLLIYKEGGVYFDIKSAMKVPLDYIIREDDEYILSHWECPCNRVRLNTELGEFQQWHIISRPGHPYLKNVIENVLKNIEKYDPKVYGVGRKGVLTVTGPFVYTDSIMPILNDHKHTIYESSDYIGFLYNNCYSNFDITAHMNMFSKKHYSKLDSPIIINNSNG